MYIYPGSRDKEVEQVTESGNGDCYSNESKSNQASGDWTLHLLDYTSLPMRIRISVPVPVHRSPYPQLAIPAYSLRKLNLRGPGFERPWIIAIVTQP